MTTLVIALIILSSLLYILIKPEKKIQDEYITHSINPSHHKARVEYIDNNGNVSFTKPADGRCLDGKPLSSDDDWEQWYVWSGFADGILGHLHDLEKELIALENTNSYATLQEWHTYYDKLREIYIRHGMWNHRLGDREPFVPTALQLAKENNLFSELETKQQDAFLMQTSYAQYSEAIFQYIASQPHHVALRSALINAVSGNASDIKPVVWKIYRRMRTTGRIKERQNELKRWEVKKTPVRHRKAEQAPTEISIYHPELYSKVSSRTEYKALITVGSPMEGSFQDGWCYFKSLSSGKIHVTTLESCSCASFKNGDIPCKHMVSLASHLGYYHISVHAHK